MFCIVFQIQAKLDELFKNKFHSFDKVSTAEHLLKLTFIIKLKRERERQRETEREREREKESLIRFLDNLI